MIVGKSYGEEQICMYIYVDREKLRTKERISFVESKRYREQKRYRVNFTESNKFRE
jgi:hypothetical protein